MVSPAAPLLSLYANSSPLSVGLVCWGVFLISILPLSIWCVSLTQGYGSKATAAPTMPQDKGSSCLMRKNEPIEAGVRVYESIYNIWAS